MRGFVAPRSRSAERKPADRPGRRPALGARSARAHFSGAAGARREEPATGAPTHGALPERLRTVMEAMSGFSLADVVVHRNSAEPARLGAAAFTKGNQIHVAPGQERHLPHEAWHAVQQKQGRVRATMQMQGGLPLNDDAGLEREADTMGARALGAAAQPMRDAGPFARDGMPSTPGASPVLQLVKVGDPFHSVMALAAGRFSGALYTVAKTILEEFKKNATDYKDADAIVAAVNADQRMKDAVTAAAVEQHTIEDKVKLTQGDIDTGRWEPIPGRKNGDHQLRVTISGAEYAYHVHPPKHPSGDPIPGELMKDGKPMGKQFPADVAKLFLAKHGRPKGW